MSAAAVLEHTKEYTERRRHPRLVFDGSDFVRSLKFSSLSQEQVAFLVLSARRADPPRRALLEDDIIRAYQPVARRHARQFRSYGADLDDLTQVANLAVLKAIRGFDPELGSFQAYAKATIDGELKRHLRDYGWSIKPPRRVQELLSQLKHYAESLNQDGGAPASTSDLARALGVSVPAVVEALTARSCYSPASIDHPASRGSLPLSDSLQDGEDAFGSVEGLVSLEQICAGLGALDRELIHMRFYECLSQSEIAKRIGVSQMEVSRRLSRLFDELRERALRQYSV